MSKILLVQSSARKADSVSRDLAARIAERLDAGAGAVRVRDLADGVSLPDGYWVANRGLAPADYDARAAAAFAESDALIAELEAAETIVIGAPIYNFGAPAALKAWIDQIARPGRTFRYSKAGPEGLLAGRKVYVALASDGVRAGSEMDFLTGHLRFVLGFVGLTDVTFVAADAKLVDPTRLAAAEAEIAELPLAA